MGDISRTLTSGVFFNYRRGVLRFRSEIRQDILNNSHGLVAKAGIGSKFPVGKPLFSAYVGTTWANKTNAQTFYGVNNRQQLNSRFGRYDADAGFQDVSVTVSSGYQLNENWAIQGRLEYRRLLDDAADSPLVSDNGSANQYLIGAGLSYIFQ